MSKAAAPNDRVFSISLHSVGKRYGLKWVLQHISATFEEGQLTLILGNNGAGKSTLLWLVSSLLHPDEGKILFNGTPSNTYSNLWLRQQLGMLSHDLMCYPQLSATENLIFFAILYGYTKEHASVLAQKWLEKTNLLHAKHKQVRTFSQGMKKRLSLAKAFLHSPSILLLDEPYTALDLDGKQILTSCIQEAKDRGAIVILATHEPSEIASRCNQAIVLHQGQMYRQQSITNEQELNDLLTTVRKAP